ncbi:MAG: hypothetical protein KGM24_08185 [Elusimicrobia bacterium]|nr:hypothetical protein [Elusimicrobiota bacterium]
MRRGALVVLAAAAALSACVPYPADQLPADQQGSSLPSLVSGVFPGLDPGAASQQSLHFQISAYGPDFASQVAAMAEQDYSRIMTDTGLYSFQPSGLYQIVVYGAQDEYQKKTGQPQWSAGVTTGNAIYVYQSAEMPGVLAHEMTHLIWYEFMNGNLSDQQRWVNEGLAVYEQSQASNRGQEMFTLLLPTLRSAPIPLDQLENMAPNTENGYQASLWYAEAEGLVRFMIERGGRIGFAQFLTSIRDGKTFDQAVASGFPGSWRTLDDVYQDWKRSLQ